ncbi:hypothetical protein F5Y10DRAFT_238316 [Nemania abortiva]|nr:hypothetical protein F5Y10DRAFT_238316 [Nemania abortiva]
MSRTPSPELPDFDALTHHAQELANGIRLLGNLPAFNDPHITTKLNRLDELTNNVDNLQQTILLNITQSLTESITQAVQQSNQDLKDDLTRQINTVRDDLTTQINTVKDDLKSAKDDIKSTKDDIKSTKDDITRHINTVKDDLTSQINTVKNDLTRQINTVKDDLRSTKDDLASRIDTLDQRLQISIAARDYNSVVRTRNASSSDKILSLHSVLTNTPIEPFPNTRAQFKKLKDPRILKILKELDDPYHEPNRGTPDDRLNRFCMLAGISEPQPWVNDPSDASD